MEAINNASKANDYAVAHAMNEEIYSTFVVVYLGDSMGVSEFHEIPNLNRAYVLLVNELQKIYARNPELLAIKPDPLWQRFDVLKNHTEEICDYIRDTEDWGLEHIAKVEKLSIIAGAGDPTFTAEQQGLLNDIDTQTKEYASKGKALWEKSKNESSQPAQKNRILRTLLANCKINQKRLQLNLLQPFSSLVSDSKSQNWLRGLDSNQRPSG